MVQEEEIRAPANVGATGPTGGSSAATLNRSLSGQTLAGQRLPQYQQTPGMPMGARPPSAGVTTPHYNPQFLASNAAAPSPGTTTSPMMMAQQRPGQMQQQRPTTAAQASQIRAGSYLQQTQQFPQTQYVHHMTSLPMNSARPGVQGAIAPGAGTQQYGNMQNINAVQQHNMQVRQQQQQQKQTPASQYIGAAPAGQQQALGPTRQGVTLPSQQHPQQPQALQQQQLNAQQRLGPQQQQAMARQTQSAQMMQNQGNIMQARVSTVGGLPSGGQPQQLWQGKPAQYQQQQQQQQAQRPQLVTNPVTASQGRPATPGAAQANNPLPSAAAAAGANAEPLDTTGSILGKRSIQDLVAQIDPRERLDPDVEEVLLEIADDFIESVALFACKLAKHRKSTVLEAKDVLLHLDKQWNITVPGFGGDEYRSYKRPSISETHKQRLAVVRKSAAAGQAAVESKATNVPATTPATNLSTPVKSGLSGPAVSPTPSPGMPRIPRV